MKIQYSVISLIHYAAREMVEMYYEFEKPFRVDSTKFIQAFGDISTSHEVAVHETISWYRDYLSRAQIH